MKITLRLIAIIWIALSLGSCSDLENEIWINADGSGKYTVSYDMSPMLEMASMFGEMPDSLQTETMDEPEGVKSSTSIDGLFDAVSDPSGMDDIDTSFTFYSELPDSIRDKITNAELLKNVQLRLLSNEAESVAEFAISIEYKDQDEMKDIMKAMVEMGNAEKGKSGTDDIEKLDEMFAEYELDLNNGVLTIAEQDFGKELLGGDMLGDDSMGDINLDSLGSEEMSMMKMMFGDASIKTKIHLPGEVISCDDPKADIFGNQIRYEDSFFEVIKNKKLKGRVIKFKQP